MSRELLLVRIDEKYCNYLRKFDNRVPYNYAKKENRPFVGVLFEVQNCKYFAALSSPKPKHLKIEDKLDFLKIDNGRLGAINFNNMIPVTKNNIEIIDLNYVSNSKKEEKYLKLLREQFYWLNRHSLKIYSNSKRLYGLYINNMLSRNIKDRCCNYPLLEEKCIEYNNSEILQEV